MSGVKCLITGVTGFLGRHLLNECLENDIEVVGLGHSEIRLKDIESDNGVKLLCGDIANKELMNSIVASNGITHIIHSAAMKHVGICQQNPTTAIETNINGSKNIIDAALNNGVKNVIGISTDKSLNPSCIYGMTKYLMEQMLLENNFSVYQGVNFFGSTGSVLDIWKKQLASWKNLTVNKEDCVRYFIEGKTTAKTIVENIDSRGKTFTNDVCFKISLHDLLDAFCDYYDYRNVEYQHKLSVEKLVEEVPQNMKIVVPKKEEIIGMFSRVS